MANRLKLYKDRPAEYVKGEGRKLKQVLLCLFNQSESAHQVNGRARAQNKSLVNTPKQDACTKKLEEDAVKSV